MLAHARLAGEDARGAGQRVVRAGGEQALPQCLVGNVALDAGHRNAQRLDAGFGFIQRAAVGQHQGSAELRQAFRGGLPNSAGGAGDEYTAVRQPERAGKVSAHRHSTVTKLPFLTCSSTPP